MTVSFRFSLFLAVSAVDTIKNEIVKEVSLVNHYGLSSFLSLREEIFIMNIVIIYFSVICGTLIASLLAFVHLIFNLFSYSLWTFRKHDRLDVVED